MALAIQKTKRAASNFEKLETRFQKAVEFYRARGGVVFVSYCRFWERHGFVQQSLARYLTENKVPVTWLDGAGWRPYRPTLSWNSPYLTVRQIPRLPGERVVPLRSISLRVQAEHISKALEIDGQKRVLWVQAGLEPGLSELLPYIDVFSTFDDPYRHDANDPLCERARLVICQNQFTDNFLGAIPQSKRVQLLPPVDVRSDNFTTSHFELPKYFPKRIMGYVGSFLTGGYDTYILEYLIRQLPDWGFLMMGRTDVEGHRDLDRLRRYQNFISFPWAKRSELGSVWKKLDLSLLLYRNHPRQDGAFPVKLLEGLCFGVPAVATQVNKTRDLSEFFPCSSFPDQLVEMAVKTADMPKNEVAKIYNHFLYQMDPRLQLSIVAEHLG